MNIRIFIEPKDAKQFKKDLRDFLNDHAKSCQETIMKDGKLIVQEESEYIKAWFFHIEKEKA